MKWHWALTPFVPAAGHVALDMPTSAPTTSHLYISITPGLAGFMYQRASKGCRFMCPLASMDGCISTGSPVKVKVPAFDVPVWFVDVLRARTTRSPCKVHWYTAVGTVVHPVSDKVHSPLRPSDLVKAKRLGTSNSRLRAGA